MMWFTRAASWASVINVLVARSASTGPSLTAGAPRMLLISASSRRIALDQHPRHPAEQPGGQRADHRQARAARRLHRGRHLLRAARRSLVPAGAASLAQLSTAALLLIFAFGGYEVVPVPAARRATRAATCRSR